MNLKRENQVKAYCFVVGPEHLDPFSEEGAAFIKAMVEIPKDSYVGVSPNFPTGIYITCRTKEEAKDVRNLLRFKKIKCSKLISECYVNKRFLQ